MVYTLNGEEIKARLIQQKIPSTYEKDKIPSARSRYAWKTTKQFIKHRERKNTSLTSWPPSGDFPAHSIK